MKFSTLLLMVFLSHSVTATSITDFYVYQTDYDIQTKQETFSAYLLKGEPCLTVSLFNNNEKTTYCEMDDSGLNLSKEFPTIYVQNLFVSGPNVYFNVVAPWNEQSCRIFVPKNKITCEATGN